MITILYWIFLLMCFLAGWGTADILESIFYHIKPGKMKGIIIVKDHILVQSIQEAFKDWLVLASATAKDEITFYLTPKI